MRTKTGLSMAGAGLLLAASAAGAVAVDQVKTVQGMVEGTPALASGVRTFKGIPFAAPLWATAASRRHSR